MIAEFLIKWWEIIVIIFLVADIVVQKTKWKGDDDILAMIKSGIVTIFTSKPGKLPMLFIGFLLMSFLLVSSAITSTSMTFEWDANTEPDLAGYRLYQSDTSGIYTFGAGNEAATIPAGTEVVTLPGLPDGTYYWVATAFDTGGQESESSNEIMEVIDAVPGCPRNLRRMF